jgi:hypothetical protein
VKKSGDPLLDDIFLLVTLVFADAFPLPKTPRVGG